MSDCQWLSDRMPKVARGQAEWTPDEAGHLSTCRACQDEWELVRLAGRVGEDLVSALDGPAISAAVLERLKHARGKRLRRRAWSFAGLAAAATLVAVLWTERPGTGLLVSDRQPVAAQLLIPLPELDSLQPAELDSVLQSMDESLVDGSTLEAPGLGDLDTTELQSVLDYWEG